MFLKCHSLIILTFRGYRNFNYSYANFSEQLRLKLLCKFVDDPTVLDHVNKGSLLIGGLDISYPMEGLVSAVVGLSVIRINDLKCVANFCRPVNIDAPYIHGFLAFREVPAYLSVVKEFEETHPRELHPHVFMVDGNGTLHPRQFGSACHLGVLLQRPTFGVAKNLSYVPSSTELAEPDLQRHRVLKKEFQDLPAGQSCDILDQFGKTCGVAFQTPSSKNPIYISPGNMINLATAINITRVCCKFRVPEPTRQADIMTRRALQQLEIRQETTTSSSTTS